MARGHNGEPGDPHADLAGNLDPVDVSAVRRDDALVDAIASDGPVATDSPEEYQVAALLANWRTEILAQPMPAEPDLDDIVERVRAELGARESVVAQSANGRSRLRLLRPVAAAAALVAIAMGGMTVFSYNAEPGDPLWGVKQVVFTERANSTVAKIDTTSNLEEAERLIATGDTAGARAKLDSAGERAGAVNDGGVRDELNVWRERLLSELARVTVPPLPPLVPPESAAVPSTPAESSPTVPGTGTGTGAVPGPQTVPGLPGVPWPTVDPGLTGIIPDLFSPLSSSPGTPAPTPSPTQQSPVTSSPVVTTTTSTPAASSTRPSSGSVGSPTPGATG